MVFHIIRSLVCAVDYSDKKQSSNSADDLHFCYGFHLKMAAGSLPLRLRDVLLKFRPPRFKVDLRFGSAV